MKRSGDPETANGQGRTIHHTLGTRFILYGGTDLPLIREFVVTTASLHDSLVDFSLPGIVC